VCHSVAAVSRALRSPDPDETKAGRLRAKGIRVIRRGLWRSPCFTGAGFHRHGG
jgi:hypothetical protein